MAFSYLSVALKLETGGVAMSWLLVAILVGLIILLVFYRVTHLRKKSGGEKKPTNSFSLSFSNMLESALGRLESIFNDVANSQEARSCHKAPELLRTIYDHTVAVTRKDFQRSPQHQRTELIQRVISYHLHQAWNGKIRVRNSHKRALLKRIQETWDNPNDHRSVPLRSTLVHS